MLAIANINGMSIDRRVCGVSCLLLMQLVGCAAQPVNPSFPVTMEDARVAWSVMEDHPIALTRPVVVLGGIYDPGFAAGAIARRIKEIAGPDAPIVHVGFLDTGSFDRSAAKVLEAVDRAFPSVIPTQTTEVDVIGVSMGGLVARYAASEMYRADSGRRLSVRTLYTISSPHTGAKLAWVPTFDKRVIDMRGDSEFLQQLNAEARNYELVAYARLGDQVVGENNAAPPGMTPRWIVARHGLSHVSAYSDTRILADIARRLRGETPLSTDPPAPLPSKQSADGEARSDD